MNKQLLFGFFLAFLLFAACASTFGYKYYYLSCDECEGTLLAKNVKDDLPLTTCRPDDVIKGKCVVMLVDEYDRLRGDVLDMRERLKHCEKSR